MSESKLRRKYLVPSNNIIELATFFNLTNKSNLTNGFQYDFLIIFW